MERQALIQRIHESRQRFDEILSHLEVERFDNRLPNSHWTIRDLIGHVGFWEQRICSLYYTLVEDKEPQSTTDDSNTDLVNERSYQDNRGKPLLEVQSEEAEAFRSILAIAENAPDADLFDENRFPWTQGRPYYQFIADNTYGHYDEHLNDLIAAAEQKPVAG